MLTISELEAKIISGKTTQAYGGFVKENILLFILKECVESGNPEDFFDSLFDEMRTIDDAIFEHEDFWEYIQT